MRKVRPADDEAHPTESRIGEVVALEKNLKGAARPAVTELGSTNVEGRSLDVLDIPRSRHEREARFGIDETADGPCGGDAIDVQTLAGHKSHRLDRTPSNTRLGDVLTRAAASSRTEVVARDDRAVPVFERDDAAMRELPSCFRAERVVFVFASGPHPRSDLCLVTLA